MVVLTKMMSSTKNCKFHLFINSTFLFQKTSFQLFNIATPKSFPMKKKFSWLTLIKKRQITKYILGGFLGWTRKKNLPLLAFWIAQSLNESIGDMQSINCLYTNRNVPGQTPRISLAEESWYCLSLDTDLRKIYCNLGHQ